MNTTKIYIHKKFQKNPIDKRIYGSFVEHLGRVVYSGIYEPGHSSSDADGFREDVLKRVKEMGVTAVRYPGGNFVSNYDWMDGIGDVSKRPRKRDLAWMSIETNEVGTDEFMKWARKAGIEPVWAVNLGTKGLESALALLEYCNLPTGTYYSDMRAKNGNIEPYHIKTWCLGNEMDGDWQIGHKTAEEYGRLAQETGKAMKLLDPSIELVVCGSSMSTNATFGDWERAVLKHTYDHVDYISLHQYYGGQNKGTPAFLAQSLDMERYIDLVCGICDLEMLKRRNKKKLNICFDEWGVWSISDKTVQQYVESHPWNIAPPISEQIYSLEDSLLFASMLMNLIKYSGRIKIACQSLLTNVSACIMTERGGDCWVQPIFYPFAMMSAYGKGIVMETFAEGPEYDCNEFTNVPYVDHVVVYNNEDNEIEVFLVNRADICSTVELDMTGFIPNNIIEARMLTHNDRKMTNQLDHTAVVPIENSNVSIADGNVVIEIMPYSFNMIRISCS